MAETNNACNNEFNHSSYVASGSPPIRHLNFPGLNREVELLFFCHK